jgi:hypothetical protein
VTTIICIEKSSDYRKNFDTTYFPNVTQPEASELKLVQQVFSTTAPHLVLLMQRDYSSENVELHSEELKAAVQFSLKTENTMEEDTSDSDASDTNSDAEDCACAMKEGYVASGGQQLKALISLKANDAMGKESNASDCNTSESDLSYSYASDSNAKDSNVSDCLISVPRAPWGSRPADIRKLHDVFNAQAAAAVSAKTPASFFFRVRARKISAAANEAFSAATFRNTPRPPRKPMVPIESGESTPKVPPGLFVLYALLCMPWYFVCPSFF